MAGFKDLADRLAELEDIPSRIASEVAEGISVLVAEEFDGSHDPYGRPWAPLMASTVKRKRGDTRILRRTDSLSTGTMASPSSGAGVEVSSVDYGGVHQAGDPPRMVSRKILPDGSDLPKAWEKVIDDAADRAFRKVMR